ncbi:Uncharacterized conserved protein [Candidatus Bartonella washoeensis]|uniref:Uncharacterized protein n=1 Tax=Candidatus Bartonella washoeensis Sb944nv TaxID=1094563 RepID=J0Q371_9HYPH|nr:hypothetical protein MCQ_01538 [Bartonella washoeensis Sb944nv]SPU27745.1 Uncharacterized conserved protein [Bartonella washoeensis]
MVSHDMIIQIRQLIEQTQTEEANVLSFVQVKNLTDMSHKQAQRVLEVLEKKQNIQRENAQQSLPSQEKTDVSIQIDRLYQIFLDKKRIAITCFEADVCMCHRGRIVNALTKLQDWKYEIQHL